MAGTGNGAGRLDFEQVISATMVVDVQISPDGRQVAYVTTPASKTGDLPDMAIWLVDADGGQARRLTTSEAMDFSPRWSPDGTRIAFASDRKERGKPQVYVLALAGGEAVRLTEHKGGIGDPQWSPDGTKLAFLARDPETDEEKQRKDEKNDHKVADADTKFIGLYVIDVPADAATLSELPEAKRLSPEGLNIGSDTGVGLMSGYSWAPDSRGLVAVATKGPKADYGFRPDVVTFDLDGKMTTLGAYEGLWSRPLYSPDGSTIAFIACEDRAPAYFALCTIPASGGEATTVIPKHNASFHALAWLPDGDRLLALSEEGQTHRFRVVDTETRGAEMAFEPTGRAGNSGGWFGIAPSLSKDATRVAFVWSDDTSYGDVYVTELGSTDNARKLTDLNPWAREIEWGEVRELSWTSTDGMQIQGLLILPTGYQQGTRYPLLLQIHGGPMAAWTHRAYASWHDWGQFMAQRGFAVLLPNPRGSSGRGGEFLCGIEGCYGEPDWHDLMTGVDLLIEQGIADPDKLVVGGWSGGGYLTNQTITRTGRFKAAVSGAGISNWVSFQGTADVRSAFDTYFGRVDEDSDNHWKHSPIRNIKNASTPTMILYGEQDVRVPVSQGYELYEGLKSRGVETQLVAYPREPHGITERKHQLDLLERVTAWFEGHVK